MAHAGSVPIAQDEDDSAPANLSGNCKMPFTDKNGNPKQGTLELQQNIVKKVAKTMDARGQVR
jgi:hypothetical protein